jgi:alkylmercury lyase
MWALSADEQELALSIYRQLAVGAPVPLSAVAEALGRDEGEIVETLEQWPGVFRADDGRIVAFLGLALPEMAHRFRIDGRTLHTWCAWDALFLPTLIGQPAEVESQSPVSDEPVRLTVSPQRVEEVVPKETVVSMLAPTADFDDTVLMSFCHFVHFFPSAADAQPWLSEHTGTFLLTVDEAFELGRLTNAAKFPGLSRRPSA